MFENLVLAPFPYVGGKSGMLKHVLPLVEGADAEVYVEPYVGAGWVFWNKRRHRVEVLNDLNKDIVGVYRCLMDPNLFAELSRRLEFTPYSREVYREALEVLESGGGDEVRRAWAWIVAYGQAMSGNPGTVGTWGISRGGSSGSCVSRWNTRMGFLGVWHDRMKGVYLECLDGVEVIRKWDSEDAVFYVDPPYPISARKGGAYYQLEMMDEDHRKLVDVLLGIKGRAVVSGYPGTVYEKLGEAGWRWKEVPVVVSSVGSVVTREEKGKGRAVEKLWWNFDELVGWRDELSIGD